MWRILAVIITPWLEHVDLFALRHTHLRLPTGEPADISSLNRWIRHKPALLIDREHQIRQVNASLLLFLGYSLSDMVDHPVTDFVPHDARALVATMLDTGFEGLPLGDIPQRFEATHAMGHTVMFGLTITQVFVAEFLYGKLLLIKPDAPHATETTETGHPNLPGGGQQDRLARFSPFRALAAHTAQNKLNPIPGKPIPGSFCFFR